MTAGRPVALAGAALLMTVACTAPQPTPYQPLDSRFGYSATRLDSGAWRVAFTGNQLNARETLEDYALRRAAELMREKGVARFAVMDRVYERYTDRTYAYNTRPGVRDPADFHRRGGSPYADPFLNSRTTTVVTQVFRLDVRPAESGTPPGAIRVHAVDEVLAPTRPGTDAPRR